MAPAYRAAHAGHVSLRPAQGHVGDRDTAARRRSAAMSRLARTAATAGSPTTAAATATAPSVRGQPRVTGSPHARQTCCRSATSTWSSPCPPRSPTSRFHNKAAVYDLLFRVASETMLTIAADPHHLGARIGLTAVLHTWGSAMTHHPHIHMIVPGGGISLDGERWVSSRAKFLLPVRVLAKLFRRRFLEQLQQLHATGRLQFFGDQAGLSDPTCLPPPPDAAPQEAVGRLRQAAVLRPASGARLFVPIHPPRRHLEPSAHRARQDRCHVPLQGLSPRQCADRQQHHDAQPGRIHPPLPAPRSAEGLPPHPSLRPPRQRRPQRQCRACPGVARCACTTRGRGRRIAARPASAMPLLRRPYGHHRDLPACGSGARATIVAPSPGPRCHDPAR